MRCKTLPLQQDYRQPLFPAGRVESCARRTEYKRRENPKTKPARIDRAHVIRRGEDATRQLRSGLVRGREHVRNISSGDFDILRKIRYESAILPLHSVTRAPTWLRGPHTYVTVTLSRTSRILSTIHLLFDHQFLIGGVFINDGFEWNGKFEDCPGLDATFASREDAT